MPARAHLAIAVAVALGLAVGLGARARGGTLYNGDEAVYAQLAREMREGGDWFTLRYDGQPLHQRPPLYVWLLAATGPSRLPSVLFTALGALAVALLARRLGGVAAMAPAAVLYGVLDLTWRYGRALESEPLFALLCVFAVERWLARRPVAFGLLVGVACMVKQVAGFLPVLAPLACLLGHERPRPRDLLAAGVAFLAVWAPWHMIMTALHGGAFWRGYLVHNVLERAATPLLGDSSPLFYLQALVRREGVPLALFLGATLGYGLLRARRRVIPDLVAALVPLLALVAFSLARTRVEYYLVAITPLLCALAAIPVARVPAAFVLMPLLAFLSHDLPDLSRLDPSGDVARLSRLAADAPRLYVIGLMPSAPRYYSGRPTTRLFADEADRARWAKIDVLGLPGVLEVVPDCERFPDGLVLVKRGDPVAERLAPCLGDAIDESPPYALVRSARGTPPASSPPQ